MACLLYLCVIGWLDSSGVAGASVASAQLGAALFRRTILRPGSQSKLLKAISPLFMVSMEALPTYMLSRPSVSFEFARSLVTRSCWLGSVLFGSVEFRLRIMDKNEH